MFQRIIITWQVFCFSAEETLKILYLYLPSAAATTASISQSTATANHVVHRVFCTWGKYVSELVKKECLDFVLSFLYY